MPYCAKSKNLPVQVKKKNPRIFSDIYRWEVKEKMCKYIEQLKPISRRTDSSSYCTKKWVSGKIECAGKLGYSIFSWAAVIIRLDFHVVFY